MYVFGVSLVHIVRNACHVDNQVTLVGQTDEIWARLQLPSGVRACDVLSVIDDDNPIRGLCYVRTGDRDA